MNTEGRYEITGPTEEPFTLGEAKKHCRLSPDDSTEDGYLEDLIPTAREQVEKLKAMAFITRTMDVRFDSFPVCIILPLPPLQSVVSIKYLDGTGAEQTLASNRYEVHGIYTPPGAGLFPVTEEPKAGFIVLAYGQSWPSIQAVPEAVRVRITCGYGSAAQVPQRIKHAIGVMVGQLFIQREPVITGTIVSDTHLEERLAWPPNFAS